MCCVRPFICNLDGTTNPIEKEKPLFAFATERLSEVHWAMGEAILLPVSCSLTGRRVSVFGKFRLRPHPIGGTARLEDATLDIMTRAPFAVGRVVEISGFQSSPCHKAYACDGKSTFGMNMCLHLQAPLLASCLILNPYNHADRFVSRPIKNHKTPSENVRLYLISHVNILA